MWQGMALGQGLAACQAALGELALQCGAPGVSSETP
jgi:hypothetical protein